MAHRTLSIGWIRVLFVILLFVSVGAAADPTGTISGVVTDPSGAVIPGATVTVKHASTGLTRSTVTDAQGAFLFPLMPVGGYGLTVEASGFRRFEQSGITLVLNSVANLPVIMQLGSLNESINVQADAAMVETRSGTLQGVVDQGRNILYGPGTFLMDFSALKNFRITEGSRIQFRAEFFNLFNTPLFNNPSTSVTDSRFGQITGARDPRIIQLALKVYF